MKATLTISGRPEKLTTVDRVLLYCGILSSAWYVLINIYVPTQFPGYNSATYTVSELSAINAPTRNLWLSVTVPYTLLFAAFGWGILRTAGQNSLLKVLGATVICYSIFNVYWPPMHQRGFEPTLTDALHITWASVTVLLMIGMMVTGALAFGGGFRLYTIVSIAGNVVFGILTSLEAPNVPTNGATPMIGVWERINIAIFMLWVSVLAIRMIWTYYLRK